MFNVVKIEEVFSHFPMREISTDPEAIIQIFFSNLYLAGKILQTAQSPLICIFYDIKPISFEFQKRKLDVAHRECMCAGWPMESAHVLGSSPHMGCFGMVIPQADVTIIRCHHV